MKKNTFKQIPRKPVQRMTTVRMCFKINTCSWGTNYLFLENKALFFNNKWKQISPVLPYMPTLLPIPKAPHMLLIFPCFQFIQPQRDSEGAGQSRSAVCAGAYVVLHLHFLLAGEVGIGLFRERHSATRTTKVIRHTQVIESAAAGLLFIHLHVADWVFRKIALLAKEEFRYHRAPPSLTRVPGAIKGRGSQK